MSKIMIIGSGFLRVIED